MSIENKNLAINRVHKSACRWGWKTVLFSTWEWPSTEYHFITDYIRLPDAINKNRIAKYKPLGTIFLCLNCSFLDFMSSMSVSHFVTITCAILWLSKRTLFSVTLNTSISNLASLKCSFAPLPSQQIMHFFFFLHW